MKTALSEKQWAAIIAVGWVLVSVHASMANSIPGEFIGEGRPLEHIRQVRAADPAGPFLIAIPRTVGHHPHEGVHGHVWPMTLDRSLAIVSASASAF
ncbi:hypothetical protein ACQKP1_15775 [Allorhizobium sp. NPDC080224]|uniref:hypothetical protein n=1 Tax=Allorhizobium sp. NPDC080224 TaxID=3390547 RepID=UPI003D02B773